METNVKKQLQDLYNYNNSMFTDNPNHVPRFTDGTEITVKHLADYNNNAINFISELLGIELTED